MKKFALLTLVSLLLTFSACTELPQGTDRTTAAVETASASSHSSAILEEDSFFTFVKTDLNGYEYANGIFYKPNNKYSPDSEEKFYGVNGEQITPGVRTVVLERTAKSFLNADNPYEDPNEERIDLLNITLDVIKQNDNTAVRLYKQSEWNDDFYICLIETDFALVVIGDNILKFNFGTESFEEFLNGEYPGVTYRNISVYNESDKTGDLWKFQTHWAHLSSISDNKKYMVFKRQIDVGRDNQSNEGYSFDILKNILTGEEIKLGNHIQVLGWDGEMLYYQKTYYSNDYINAEYEIIKRDCATGEETAIGEKSESFFRPYNNYEAVGIPIYWDISTAFNILTIRDRINGCEFSVALGEEHKIIQPHFRGVSRDGKYFIVSWDEKLDGARKTHFRLINYRFGVPENERIACSFTIPEPINNCEWLDDNTFAMKSSSLTYFIDIRRIK